MGTHSNVKRFVVALGLMSVLGLGLGACSGDDGDTTVSAGDPAGPDDSTGGESPGSSEEEPGELPDGDPTILATIVSGDAGAELTDVQGDSASDEDYYAGGIADITASTVLVDADGQPIDLSDVFDQPAEVWLDACQESFPVQCEVLAVRLLADDDDPEGAAEEEEAEEEVTQSDPALGGVPDEPPTVVGTIISGDAGAEITDVDEPGELHGQRYAGGLVSFSEDTVTVDADGDPVEVWNEPAEIWLGDCEVGEHQTFCDVIAVRLLD
jgi:hypothetical protein